ncbi:MAG: GNAT family N-acetyltransferase [Lachnospiraceae bacterium]|nr:GNAT family N-acetyltransferase [Lachnospiraceae bacterium]
MKWTVKTFDELTGREVYEILRARAEVFIKEQGIHCVDPDMVDYKSLHIFAMKKESATIEHNGITANTSTVGESICAYLRAYPVDDETMKVGRILAVPHGTGIGTELMKYAIRVIVEKTGCRKIVMDAQKHAVAFYERFGFSITSDEYLEEGVVHVDMCRKTE